MNFFGVFGRPGVSVELFNNFTVGIQKISLQIDIALPSVVAVSEHLAIILWLELSLNFFSSEFVFFLETFILNSKESNDFRGPEKLVIGYFIAESFEILYKADDLFGVLLANLIGCFSNSFSNRCIARLFEYRDLLRDTWTFVRSRKVIFFADGIVAKEIWLFKSLVIYQSLQVL